MESLQYGGRLLNIRSKEPKVWSSKLSVHFYTNTKITYTPRLQNLFPVRCAQHMLPSIGGWCCPLLCRRSPTNSPSRRKKETQTGSRFLFACARL